MTRIEMTPETVAKFKAFERAVLRASEEADRRVYEGIIRPLADFKWQKP